MKRIAIPVVLLLTACEPTAPPQPETGRVPNPAFETQVQAMQKARAAEGQVMDAAEAQRRQIEDATRP